MSFFPFLLKGRTRQRVLCSITKFPLGTPGSRLQQATTGSHAPEEPIRSAASSAPPSDMERFCLHLLLHHVRGPQSFTHLLTVNGYTHATFQEAAEALGLLQRDDEYEQCLAEAISIITSGHQLRRFSVTILVFGKPSNPGRLWTTYCEKLSEDYQYQYLANNLTLNIERCVAEALRDINNLLSAYNKSLSDFRNFPPLSDPSIFTTPLPSSERIPQSNADLAAQAANAVSCLNNDQRAVFDAVVSAVQDRASRNRMFFVDGPGGSGKTYLYNTLLAHFVRRARLPLLLLPPVLPLCCCPGEPLFIPNSISLSRI